MIKNNLVEQPLEYWEKDSYFQIILSEYEEDLFVDIKNRVEAMEGVKVNQFRDLTDTTPGGIRLTYDGEEYDIGYYPTEFRFYEMYARGPYYVSIEELNEIRESKFALTVYMPLGSNPKKAFHFQLKLCLAIAPSLKGIIDESAEKLLPSKWVRMTANSKSMPSTDTLYTIQAVSDENGEIWIHTHGLARCGITELEILQSNEENYNTYYNLISTYASYLLDNKDENPHHKVAHIGLFENQEPILVTCVSWTEALDKYENLSVGNIEDRSEIHNTKTSVIFLYKNEMELQHGKMSKIDDFPDLWRNNPLFFISIEETRIRSDIAKERFDYLKTQAQHKENNVFIKIALPVNQNGQYEHIYFRLLSVDGDKFKAVLLQEPYANLGIHPGYEGVFTLDDVSDWYIDTPNGYINPSNVYVLD